MVVPVVLDPIVVGQRIPLEFTFRLRGVATDPVIVQCLVRKPSGSLVTMVHPDETLTRLDEGLYEASVVVDEAGTWAARFDGAGTVDAVGELSFTVLGSAVLNT